MSLKQLQFVLMLSAAVTLILTQGCKSSSSEDEKDAAQTPVVQEEAKPEVKVEEPAPAVEQPAAPAVVTTPYVIQKGDTISGIAVRHNLRWQDVLAVNEKLDPKKLHVGKTIQLPGKVEVVKPASTAKHADKKAEKKVSAAGNYVVQSGDSLGLIAKKHGTSVAAIKKANNLSSDVVRVGQKLNIPGAKGEKKAVSKKANAASKATTASPTVTPPPAPAVEPAPVAAPTAAPATEALTPPPATPVDATAIAAPAPAPAAAATQTYTVREGEDIYAIAIRWGVSPTELKNLNGLTTTEVKAGQVLKIPVAAE